jgi:hypothetical protein
MKIKEDLYSYNYRDGRVASVEKNGKSVLEIERDAMTEEVTGLALPGTWETIRLAVTAERPVVEAIGGKNVVSLVEKTLGEVTPASGGGKVAFEQTVNGELNPTIKLGDQLIAWNPATKKIAKDGEWTYDIKPGAGPFDNAAIGRENARNQSEFWHRDNAKGEEIVQGIDGSKKVTTWFTSGNLAGKKRETSIQDKYGKKMVSKYFYDEKGRVSRQLSPNGRMLKILYDEFNRVIKASDIQTGEIVVEKTYDSTGRETVNKLFGRTTKTYFKGTSGFDQLCVKNPHLQIVDDLLAIKEVSTEGNPNKQILAKLNKSSSWKLIQ